MTGYSAGRSRDSAGRSGDSAKRSGHRRWCCSSALGALGCATAHHSLPVLGVLMAWRAISSLHFRDFCTFFPSYFSLSVFPAHIPFPRVPKNDRKFHKAIASLICNRKRDPPTPRPTASFPVLHPLATDPPIDGSGSVLLFTALLALC